MGMAAKARCIGWMAKGRFTTTDARSRPSKVNMSRRPTRASYRRPRGAAPPKAVKK
jgi:hypothetical protein